MRIKINLQIFLFSIIFLFMHQIKIYACIMVFAFFHELGHLLAGIVLKLKPKKIELMPFGFSIIFEDYGYRKLIEVKRISIALAGPITNIIIAIIAYYLKINYEIKMIIIHSNILIFIFNMFPMYPLDGGRILKGILKMCLNNEKADDLTYKISNILMILLTTFSSILILYHKNISILFIITYLWIIVVRENKRYNLKKRMYKILQNDYKTAKCIDI